MKDGIGGDAEQQLEQSTGVGNLFSYFDFASLVDSGRDNLYATTYIMNMFTYETYHLENMYESARLLDPESECGKVKDNIYHLCKPSEATAKPGNMKNVYENTSILGDAKSGWLNESPTFTYNKSLTNKMIGKMHDADETKDNEKLSWSYGNEVEYILYGGSNESNKKKINTTIFFIRYALNLGPVMTYYYTYDVITDIAAAVSSATMGVIPEPLVMEEFVLKLREWADEDDHVRVDTPNGTVTGSEALPGFLKKGEPIPDKFKK